ncbi:MULTISPECIES: hypothetical protein [unclassified Roseovarius]|uniref:hypothetical protein n=1 Tax=unclassified Roseovarius TaxID=2614913 RepID=UPI00273E4A3E|nr:MULTISPECIES: hypothetical protein [unclassified Roseovarius]
MATEFNTGSDASLNEAVKSRYEANADTNAFTDNEKSKLSGIPAGAEPNAVDSVNGATGAVNLNADDIDDGSTNHKFATAAQLSKLNGIETGATADQTGSEIVSAIDAELGGSTWQSGGGGGGGPADRVIDVAQNRILGRVSTGTGDSEELTAADVRALLNVSDGASPDQNGAEIKTLYEGQSNTNAFTDAEKSKLSGVASGATANTGALADTDTVGTGEIDDAAVTLPKLAPIATNRLLGRTSGGTGEVQTLNSTAVRAILNVLSATSLASNTSGQGASLIGLEDSGALFTAADVEAALQELATKLDNYGDVVTLDQSDVVLQGGQDVIVFDAGGDSAVARPTQSATKTVIWFNHGASMPANLGTYDIAVGGGFGVASVNTQTGAAYTLSLADAGLNVDMTSAAANTVTIPTNASTAFAVGATISITQLGAGPTTVDGAGGVAVNGVSGGSVDINNQYSGCVLRKIGTDAWVIQGDIT